MSRVIWMVIDSVGVGALKDSEKFGDIGVNTLGNIVKNHPDIKIPNMIQLGLGNIDGIDYLQKAENPIGSYGKCDELSCGKDTTTGHWEMTGVIVEKPFKTFPNGFTKDIIDEFEKRTGRKVVGNKPASGTAILDEYGEHQMKTGDVIVYTSADSVFQIAVDTDMIPLETLYEWCKIARRILTEDNYYVSRVIARPYKVIDGKPTRISKDRRDYSIEPIAPTLLNEVKDNGGKVIGIGKIEDIFSKSGITHAIHTGSNKEGLELTLKAVKHELPLEDIAYIKGKKYNNQEIIFTNLVDTDMLYGHRNDAKGYGKAIEEIDTYIKPIIDAMEEYDLLIITADHGCDPTVPGTDHTREKVPFLMYSKSLPSQGNLGEIEGFDSIASFIRDWI